jgi:hypothetical protein
MNISSFFEILPIGNDREKQKEKSLRLKGLAKKQLKGKIPCLSLKWEPHKNSSRAIGVFLFG